jgi:hypothetical protein
MARPSWHELDDRISPLYRVQIPSKSFTALITNVFAGVAKGYAPASFGEQEKEL